MTEEQTRLLIATLTILVNTGIFALLVQAARGWLLGHLGAERYRTANAIVRQAVLATEQVAVANGWTNSDKLRTALAQAESLAEAHGVHLDATDWHVLVEAAVKDMHDYAAELSGATGGVAPATWEVAPPVVVVAPPAGASLSATGEVGVPAPVVSPPGGTPE